MKNIYLFSSFKNSLEQCQQYQLLEADNLSDWMKLYALGQVLKKKVQIHNINRSANGKPTHEEVYFSMSHSKDLYIIAVADLPIGLDVEYCNQNRSYMSIASRYYHSEEIADLFAMQANERVHHFYKLWTLKESAIKLFDDQLISGIKKYRFSSHEQDGILMYVDQQVFQSSLIHGTLYKDFYYSLIGHNQNQNINLIHRPLLLNDLKQGLSNPIK